MTETSTEGPRSATSWKVSADTLQLVGDVVDTRRRSAAARLLAARGIRLPTFRQLASPWMVPADIGHDLAAVDPALGHPGNLFRIHWFNDELIRGVLPVPDYCILDSRLTGVAAPIVLVFGDHFPMIGSHKVLPAYACLVSRLVTGRFDPSTHRAIWPSTGNYARGGVAISRILGCRGAVVIPERMSRERFDWLRTWVQSEEDVIRTPGGESNVKEVFDACGELAQSEQNVVLNQFCEFPNHLAHYLVTGEAFGAVVEDLLESHPGWSPSWFVAASGSAGTLASGDALKDAYHTRIAVVEPAECPTLLRNGFGDHNIQGIGDKHVPLIHNVMNTDAVIAVSDRATDELNLVVNSPIGLRLLADEGVPHETLGAFAHMGLSGIANLIAAIKLAKRLSLGPDDLVLTLATDGAGMYQSEREDLLERRFDGELLEPTAREIIQTHLDEADGSDVLETTEADRQRIFNLGYYTWVEQQKIPLSTFEARRDQDFWRSIRSLLEEWDELIVEFNQIAAST